MLPSEIYSLDLEWYFRVRTDGLESRLRTYLDQLSIWGSRQKVRAATHEPFDRYAATRRPLPRKDEEGNADGDKVRTGTPFKFPDTGLFIRAQPYTAVPRGSSYRPGSIFGGVDLDEHLPDQLLRAAVLDQIHRFAPTASEMRSVRRATRIGIALRVADARRQDAEPPTYTHALYEWYRLRGWTLARPPRALPVEHWEHVITAHAAYRRAARPAIVSEMLDRSLDYRCRPRATPGLPHIHDRRAS